MRRRPALVRALLALAPGTTLGALRLEGEALGAAGEALAARALARRGWHLLGRRTSTPEAEVDLVLLTPGQRRELVVVEVKSGRSSVAPERFDAGRRWRPGHRFEARDLERCRRAAARIASRSGGCPWRVDLVELVLFPGGARRLYHHPRLARPLPRPTGRGTDSATTWGHLPDLHQAAP